MLHFKTLLLSTYSYFSHLLQSDFSLHLDNQHLIFFLKNREKCVSLHPVRRWIPHNIYNNNNYYCFAVSKIALDNRRNIRFIKYTQRKLLLFYFMHTQTKLTLKLLYRLLNFRIMKIERKVNVNLYISSMIYWSLQISRLILIKTENFKYRFH